MHKDVVTDNDTGIEFEVLYLKVIDGPTYRTGLTIVDPVLYVEGRRNYPLDGYNEMIGKKVKVRGETARGDILISHRDEEKVILWIGPSGGSSGISVHSLKEDKSN